MNTDNYIRKELFSKAVKAGKRTYFFDVKATKAGEEYITLTESKRRFDNQLGKFVYEKHKLFLFQEDFDKFLNGFNEAVGFINNSDEEREAQKEAQREEKIGQDVLEKMSNLEFEDLDT